MRQIKLPDNLLEYPKFVPGIRRAPSRGMPLNKYQIKIALKNALRYIPKKFAFTNCARIFTGAFEQRKDLWL